MMTPVELKLKRFKAFVDAFGYADAIWFIQQVDNGSGDYTKERHQWLDQLTLDDIWADMQKRQSLSNQNPDTAD